MTTKIFTIFIASFILSACGQKIITLPPPAVSTPSPSSDILQCLYTDNGQTTIAYIKDKLIRFSGQNQQTGVEAIIRDNKFYLWNSTDKKGISFDLSPTNGIRMNGVPINNTDDVIDRLKSSPENCRPSSAAESLFNLPADIVFSPAPNLTGTK